MNGKLILPFSTSNKKTTKNTFKIMNNKDLMKISKQKGKGLLNIIKTTLFNKNNSNKNLNKNSNIKFTKASESKKYYSTIKNIKKGGNLKSVLFPTGLSGATAVLGLAALRHAMLKSSNKSPKKISKPKSISQPKSKPKSKSKK